MAVVAVLAVTGVAVGGCSDDEAPDAGQLADELIEETGGALDEAQADCVAEGLITSFGDDSFRAVIDAAEDGGDAGEDVRVEVIDIFAACDALDAVVLEATPADDAG